MMRRKSWGSSPMYTWPRCVLILVAICSSG
uniref:Uncharacterized protein n=1 Tax=Anguilla anguilla TaxID=7936 RepID=A0A0E9VGG0_ANGAN